MFRRRGATCSSGWGSPAQAANFVLPILAEFPHIETHYLPQTHRAHAVRQIVSLWKRDPNATVALIGYSYGGNAAHRVAHRISNIVQRDELFPLVVTIDPVGKWRLDTTLSEVGAYSFTRARGAVDKLLQPVAKNLQHLVLSCFTAL